MTISSENRKVIHNGNSSATSFSFTFKVFAKADLRVVLTDGGIETDLVLDSAYSVSLNADQNNNPGGTVTYPLSGSPLATGDTLTILGAVDFLQETDIQNLGGFLPEVIENALDRMTILAQQLKERIDATLQLAVSADPGVSTELPPPEANALLGWNATANELQNVSPTTLATIVTFGTTNADIFNGTGAQTAFTLSANPGALNNLDISIGGVTQVPGTDYTWTSGTTLTFTSAPPSGTGNILVRYMQALPQGEIGDGTVTNAKVANGAAIESSKLDFSANDVRLASGLVAFGQNSDNLAKGLQIGGGDAAYGSDGTLAAPDGHASWLRFQPSKNESPIEFLIYPSASQGIAQAQNGTNQILRTSGTSFTSAWVGKKFYFNSTAYLVATVTDANTMTVTTTGGGAVTFSSTFSDTFHVCYVYGTGTCSVSGTTVSRINGDPFIPFVSAPFVLKINGTTRAVSSFTDTSTLVLSSAPGDIASATYTFETDINDQITTLRLQKLIGADEENLSVYANSYGYHVRSFFAGSGQERPIQFGTASKNHLTLQTNGDVSIGGDYTYEAIRVLYASNGVNRMETTPAATTFSPAWRARGSDTNVGMGFDAQGTGTFTWTGGSFSKTLFQVFGSTTGTSWLAVGASTTDGPILSANGAASNIDVRLSPKGSGAVWIGAWTTNVDAAVNGYITVKDSSGNTRKIATIA